MSSSYHIPVMLQPCIDALSIKPSGTYVDVTFGGGGHSRHILKSLNENGKLYAFDNDIDAQTQIPIDKRLTLIKSNFAFTKNYLTYFKALPVDGIIADLGISSFQIDNKERGFAFMQDGPLDMRMDASTGVSAETWLSQCSERELVHTLSAYGEVKNAITIAKAIKSNLPLKTTKALADVCRKHAPRGKENSSLAKIFQAIRIEINQELQALKELLNVLSSIVKKDGRVVIMSYHSLEDRLVKRWLQTGNIEGNISKDFYGNVLRPFTEVNRKTIIASAEEVQANPRSRSAKLRVASKT